MNEEHDKDCCSLCGGTGEVQITPYGQADSHADVFGCPACIQADRDEAERERDQLQARVNELESQELSWRKAMLCERKKVENLLSWMEHIQRAVLDICVDRMDIHNAAGKAIAETDGDAAIAAAEGGAA